MHYVDGSSYVYYLKTPLESVRNAGWLDCAHPFDRGSVSPALIEKLEAIIASDGAFNAHVNRIRGVHPCSICGVKGPIEVGATRVVLGSSEIWIPCKEAGNYWAAPSMIYHYIKDHGYQPPAGFLHAVMAVDLGSEFDAQEEYLRMVAGHF